MRAFFKHHTIYIIIWLFLLVVVLISGYLSFFADDAKPPNSAAPNLKSEEQIEQNSNTILTAPQKENTRNDPSPVKQSSDNAAITTTGTIITTPTTTTADNLINNEEEKGAISTVLKIENSEYPAQLAENSSVYDLMKKMADESKIAFSGKEYGGMGFFIQEINGIKNDVKTGKYWFYYINGQRAVIGISLYFIQPNDVISWKYENTNL